MIGHAASDACFRVVPVHGSGSGRGVCDGGSIWYSRVWFAGPRVVTGLPHTCVEDGPKAIPGRDEGSPARRPTPRPVYRIWTVAWRPPAPLSGPHCRAIRRSLPPARLPGLLAGRCGGLGDGPDEADGFAGHGGDRHL